MSVNLENEYDFGFDAKALIEDILNKSLNIVGCGHEMELNVVVTDDAEIRAVNREFRNIDRATDVLSFPMIEFDAPANFDNIDFCDPSLINYATDELILGDIMLSYDKVNEQSNEYGHSVKREFAFLITHGILHLLGFDHENQEDEIIMREKQTEILNCLGIMR